MFASYSLCQFPGDRCDPDDDGDYVMDLYDNCPLISNRYQRLFSGKRWFPSHIIDLTRGTAPIQTMNISCSSWPRRGMQAWLRWWRSQRQTWRMSKGCDNVSVRLQKAFCFQTWWWSAFKNSVLESWRPRPWSAQETKRWLDFHWLVCIPKTCVITKKLRRISIILLNFQARELLSLWSSTVLFTWTAMEEKERLVLCLDFKVQRFFMSSCGRKLIQMWD